VVSVVVLGEVVALCSVQPFATNEAQTPLARPWTMLGPCVTLTCSPLLLVREQSTVWVSVIPPMAQY
jgi:hypothetical protein